MKDMDLGFPRRALRSPSQVMRLDLLAASFPTRLSFLRVLTRRLATDRAIPRYTVWDIDAQGIGHAVATLNLGGHRYSLVAVTQALDAAQRSDRVIATAWDAAFVLYDGVPDRAEIARISDAAPRQEAVQFTERDLALSRANKSVRLFSHVVDVLRAGGQPDLAEIDTVGYLMRTTAVYGNGKYGISDHACFADRPGLSGPFAAEILTVWMIRNLTHDLVEHLGGARLNPARKRHLGIGDAARLGMAPFLVSHPVLLNNWISARETALARIRAVPHLTPMARDRLATLHMRAASYLNECNVANCNAQADIQRLQKGWRGLANVLTRCATPEELVLAAKPLCLGTQVLTLAWFFEAFVDLVNDLADTMSDHTSSALVTLPDLATIRQTMRTRFAWALSIDFKTAAQQRRFWYVSEEKLEPRIADRLTEPG